MLPSLADITQQTPDPAFMTNVMLLSLIVAQLLSVVLTGIGLWMQSKRHPPILEELYKDFVLRKDFAESVVVLHNRIDKTKNAIDALAKEVSRGFADTERALGRIEGHIK